MAQPVQFQTETGGSLKIPKVDSDGKIILSPDSPINFSGTVDVDVPHYLEGTATAAADGIVALGKMAANTLSSFLIDDNRLQVVKVADSTLPSGAATSANQTTIIGHVDGIETILTTISSAFVNGQANITATSLPLPTGAATSANQTTIIGHLDGVEGLLSTIASALNSAITGGAINITATDLPLPTGAATATRQDTTNAYLATISSQLLATLTAHVSPVSTANVTGTAYTVSTAVVTLAALNTSRKSIIISNFAAGNLYIGETSTVAASGANTGILVPAFSSYSDSGHGIYTGQLFGIYSTAMTSHNVSIRDRS